MFGISRLKDGKLLQILLKDILWLEKYWNAQPGSYGLQKADKQKAHVPITKKIVIYRKEIETMVKLFKFDKKRDKWVFARFGLKMFAHKYIGKGYMVIYYLTTDTRR